VLLKAFDARGFVFYTNFESRKGQQLAANPQAALLFLWKQLREQVQVKIEGTVEPVDLAEADAYFASRPRPSQIGAWASLQSRTLDSRELFEARIDAFEKKFAGMDVPRPPHWSGFRVVPERIEFWYGARFRLHERHHYERVDGQWRKRMLFP
jgi:pyridoxamine 5'-phosphate oxidase